MKIAAIIPARYDSSRFPGKPLADLAGKSLIRRVYERVAAMEFIDQTIVATDDARIFDHVRQFGGEVRMTAADHASGTDRIAEVGKKLTAFDVIINVQGDEPFVQPAQLETLVTAFEDTEVSIATLGRKITDEADLFSPNVVKVVVDEQDNALYFSRHAIPYLRDLPLGQWLNHGKHFQHLGLYAFRRTALTAVTQLPVAALEAAERLEQLRWLSAGYRIRLAWTDQPSIGIDTPEDLRAAREYFN